MIAALFKEVPRPAFVLGLAGLLPFLAGPVLHQVFGDRQFGYLALEMQALYGAVILSFLGGIHWGAALVLKQPDWRRLGWSVTPSLIGWGAMIFQAPFSLVVMIAGFALAFYVDARAIRGGFLPIWFLPLRRVLTLGAILSLAVSVALVGI